MKTLFPLIKLLILLSILFFIIYFTRPIWLKKIGYFLIVHDEISKADVILVVGGDKYGERVKVASALYHKGFAPKMILSGGLIGWKTTEAEIMKKEALFLKVREKDIILEENAHSTYENAKNIFKIMKKKKLKSGILVTSNYHTRRAAYIFKKLFKNSEIKLYIFSSNSPDFNPQNWWKNEEALENLYLEYLKLIWYFLHYR